MEFYRDYILKRAIRVQNLPGGPVVVTLLQSVIFTKPHIDSIAD